MLRAASSVQTQLRNKGIEIYVVHFFFPKKMKSDNFWSSFHLKPVKLVPDPSLFDFDQETAQIALLAKQFVEMVDSAELTNKAVSHIQYVSDDLALESPLTPQVSMFAAVEAGSVGETFKKRFRVCRCKKCKYKKDSDWYEGPCGDLVLPYEPDAYVHVNLSRKVPSIEEFSTLLAPQFKKLEIRFRMLPGDSQLTLVLLAKDRKEEKAIRRLLRQPQYRIEKGIRVFQTTSDLYGSKSSSSSKKR